MGAYRDDRAWSDQFLPQLRALIGPHLLVPSTLEQDTAQATDLVVLVARDMRIACRVRRNKGFASKYPNEFTIRSRRDNGAETELSKVLSGWGDWMFYGHATGDGIEVDPWWLIDLAAFRAHLASAAAGDITIQTGQKSNGDGTYFNWFKIDSFPASPPIVVAESAHPWPARGRIAPWPRPVAGKTCKHKPEYRVNGRCWVCQSMNDQPTA